VKAIEKDDVLPLPIPPLSASTDGAAVDSYTYRVEGEVQ